MPDPREVLIATEVATISSAEQAMVSGGMAAMLTPSVTPPYTPGWDLVGRVVDGVDDSPLGHACRGGRLQPDPAVSPLPS